MKKIFASALIIVSLSYSQYALNVERIGGASHFGEENVFRASLIYNGKTINNVERKLPFDVPFPASTINETTGIFILSFPFDGFVEVYNAKGIKIWQQNFFNEMEPNYERTITVALGNSVIAFLTSDVTLSNAFVHRFTIDGAKQWETVLPYPMGYEIALSPDEKTIIAGSYFVSNDKVHQSASMIDAKGLIAENIDILFRKAAFSEDGKFIALSSDREVVVVSNETDKELSRTAKQTKGIITDVIWNGENLILQECNVVTSKNERFYYSSPTFISYSKELKEISRQRMDDVTFKSSTLKKTGMTIELNYEGKSTKVLNK